MSSLAKSGSERRSMRRWTVMLPATLTIEGRDHPCTILDLSESGARILARGLQFGPSLAELQSERFGCLAARILWARGAEAGLRFEAAAEEVMKVLRPFVPGLGRREKASAPQASGPRRSFGRMIRDVMAA